MQKPSWWQEADYKWERVKEALQRDWQQTMHDLHMGGHELNQRLADTMAQAAGRQSMPPIDEANPPRVLFRWEDAEIPIGYGYAARTHFGDRYPEWNDALEDRLKTDWRAERPWSEVRLLVRHGYEVKR